MLQILRQFVLLLSFSYASSLCTIGDRAFCNNLGICIVGNVCLCDDTIHYLSTEQCATFHPLFLPTSLPTGNPSGLPTYLPTTLPTRAPTLAPTTCPSLAPTMAPTKSPTAFPSFAPTAFPSFAPTSFPSFAPTAFPSLVPTYGPTMSPTPKQSASPTLSPTLAPSPQPTLPSPTMAPTSSYSTSSSNHPAFGGIGPLNGTFSIIAAVIVLIVAVVILWLLIKICKKKSAKTAPGLKYNTVDVKSRKESNDSDKELSSKSAVSVQSKESSKMPNSIHIKHGTSWKDTPSVLNKAAFRELVHTDMCEMAYDNLANASGVVMRKDLVKFLNLTDVFLSHNWGKDETGADNHARVAKINEGLKKYRLRTWFDEEKMSGNIQTKMTRGIDHSQCVIVFVTNSYIAKVDSDDTDNCKAEFSYALTRKGVKNIVTVVMEPSVTNTKSWFGPVGSNLGSHLFTSFAFPFNDEAKFDEAMKVLHKAIMEVIGTSVNLLEESEQANDEKV